jgi:hypothetical protein
LIPLSIYFRGRPWLLWMKGDWATDSREMTPGIPLEIYPFSMNPRPKGLGAIDPGQPFLSSLPCSALTPKNPLARAPSAWAEKAPLFLKRELTRLQINFKKVGGR